jgi:hypothetical protein
MSWNSVALKYYKKVEPSNKLFEVKLFIPMTQRSNEEC